MITQLSIKIEFYSLKKFLTLETIFLPLHDDASCTYGKIEKQREDVYERDIQQQGEGKGLNRRTPEDLAISDVLILIVTHYFDE